MIVKEYTINAADGMHARPATTLVRLTKKFSASVQIRKDDKHITVNSLLNILGLALKRGDVITVMIDGADENDAAEAVGYFFNEQLKDL